MHRRTQCAVAAPPRRSGHHAGARRRARAHAGRVRAPGRRCSAASRRSPNSASSARCGASTARTSTRGRCSRRCPPRRRTCSRAPARTPASSRSATAWPSRSRSSRTTIRRPSSRTRARPPASAAFCATSSRWARAPSRCSTRCASASLDSPRVRYLFAGVVKGIGDYGNCVGVPTVAGEVVFDPAYEGNPLVNAMCVGLLREDGADSRRGPGRRQSDHRRRRAHRARRHSRRVVRVGGPLATQNDAKRPRVQVGDPFTEKLLLEASLELIRSGAHRRHPGHGRRRPHVVVGRDGGARRRRRRRSTRRRCRCARTA